MLTTLATYLAPATTMIAAMMTAANLGTRVTGWGFVVFAVGAIGWMIQGIATGQQNLVLSNGFLLVVDLVGVWRWLGRQRRYEDGAQAAHEASAGSRAATLFPVSKLAGAALRGQDGETLGTAVEAMAAAEDGGIAYLVVSRGGMGGLGETLQAVGWGELRYSTEALWTTLTDRQLAARPALDRACWPESAEAAGVA